MPKFSVQKGYEQSFDREVASGETVIGRDLSCGIILEDGDVSRRHAKVSRSGNRVVIEDNGSQNGTFVNYSPISGVCELKHQDVVQIGKNMLVYHDDEAAPSPISPPPEGEDDGSRTVPYRTFEFARTVIRRIEENLAKVFKGKPLVIRDLLVCLFSDGHLLIEDVPGVGKSILAQALAKCVHGVYRRIQFTPDMLPSDITGISVFNDKTREFSFVPGPIFGNIILADEINRTTPRTQSSLLECMAEAVITIDGKPHLMPRPFFVIATQNPSDFHGTYPLPEPQLDRFNMRIRIGYPDIPAEKEILLTQAVRHPLNDISFVVSAMEVAQCSALIRTTHVSDPIREYIVAIVDATRRHAALVNGCSPRASLALMRLGQSLAAYHGRDYVIPADIRDLAVPALAHRVALKLKAQGKWANPDAVIRDVVESVPVRNEEERL